MLSEEKKYGIHSKFQKTGAENGESRKFGICQELNQDNKRGEIEELSSMQDNKEQDGGSINQKKSEESQIQDSKEKWTQKASICRGSLKHSSGNLIPYFYL